MKNKNLKFKIKKQCKVSKQIKHEDKSFFYWVWSCNLMMANSQNLNLHNGKGQGCGEVHAKDQLDRAKFKEWKLKM
jgi:hypothetical protein